APVSASRRGLERRLQYCGPNRLPPLFHQSIDVGQVVGWTLAGLYRLIGAMRARITPSKSRKYSGGYQVQTKKKANEAIHSGEDRTADETHDIAPSIENRRFYS